MKRRGEKIVMVTAYDAPSARLADAAGVDLVLVGDSSGMVVHGRESTVAVTLDEIVLMTQWVTRGAKRPLVIADMPFGSYEASDEHAVTNAIRLVKEGGADAVKLERGGRRSRARGDRRRRHPRHGSRRADAADGEGARRLQGAGPDGRPGAAAARGGSGARGAGCFAIVLEAVPAPSRGGHAGARGADDRDRRGRDCDGQVLVWHDMLGYYGGMPRDS